MPRLTLVRHGEAAAGWGDDDDPGLSQLGRAQAAAVADALGPHGPLPVLVSPLLRCRETAAPLATRWGVEEVVEPRVGEIRSPTTELDERSDWLRGVLAARWSELGAQLRDWADELVECLLSVPGDAVVFSHFVAVNVAIGRAVGDDRVVVRRIANGARTVLDTDGRSLRLVSEPEVAHTDVL